ncbi:protein of unknown function [Pseudomonas marincola]|uniref:Uncharacterized protein n=1 Tax=Pseudomonas marincola TaxID=437900 RepID=A0A8S2BKC6_9PSED|nr:protein of unknown function [Pseudomonas marincola]
MPSDQTHLNSATYIYVAARTNKTLIADNCSNLCANCHSPTLEPAVPAGNDLPVIR